MLLTITNKMTRHERSHIPVTVVNFFRMQYFDDHCIMMRSDDLMRWSSRMLYMSWFKGFSRVPSRMAFTNYLRTVVQVLARPMSTFRDPHLSQWL